MSRGTAPFQCSIGWSSLFSFFGFLAFFLNQKKIRGNCENVYFEAELEWGKHLCVKGIWRKVKIEVYELSLYVNSG